MGFITRELVLGNRKGFMLVEEGHPKDRRYLCEEYAEPSFRASEMTITEGSWLTLIVGDTLADLDYAMEEAEIPPYRQGLARLSARAAYLVEDGYALVEIEGEGEGQRYELTDLYALLEVELRRDLGMSSGQQCFFTVIPATYGKTPAQDRERVRAAVGDTRPKREPAEERPSDLLDPPWKLQRRRR